MHKEIRVQVDKDKYFQTRTQFKFQDSLDADASAVGDL